MVRQVCRVIRIREIPTTTGWSRTQETAWLITSLDADKAGPERLLELNRQHWGIEVMHRHKDFTLGEDGYTNRLDHAPRNISTVLAFCLTILKNVTASPTRAIEHFQNDRNRALRLI